MCILLAFVTFQLASSRLLCRRLHTGVTHKHQRTVGNLGISTIRVTTHVSRNDARDAQSSDRDTSSRHYTADMILKLGYIAIPCLCLF